MVTSPWQLITDNNTSLGVKSDSISHRSSLLSFERDEMLPRRGHVLVCTHIAIYNDERTHQPHSFYGN